MLLCSLSEVYEYDAHVIATLSFGTIDVRGQQGVEEALSDLAELDFALHLDVDVINDLLTRLGLPNAVTTHDREVSLARDLVHFDVRQRCDRLLVQLQSRVLLVRNVTNGPRKIQITINSAFHVYC